MFDKDAYNESVEKFHNLFVYATSYEHFEYFHAAHNPTKNIAVSISSILKEGDYGTENIKYFVSYNYDKADKFIDVLFGNNLKDTMKGELYSYAHILFAGGSNVQITFYLVGDDKMNIFDFREDIQIKDLVYDKVVEIINKVRKNTLRSPNLNENYLQELKDKINEDETSEGESEVQLAVNPYCIGIRNNTDETKTAILFGRNRFLNKKNFGSDDGVEVYSLIPDDEYAEILNESAEFPVDFDTIFIRSENREQLIQKWDMVSKNSRGEKVFGNIFTKEFYKEEQNNKEANLITYRGIINGRCFFSIPILSKTKMEVSIYPCNPARLFQPPPSTIPSPMK